VQIEHVAGIGFAARRTAQQQRDLAIGDGLLGQIVINDQGVFAVVHEVLAHGAAGVGRQVLHRGRLDAEAATMMVWPMAPCSSSLRTTLAMVFASGRWRRRRT
jgi:hypothetical protein